MGRMLWKTRAFSAKPTFLPARSAGVLILESKVTKALTMVSPPAMVRRLGSLFFSKGQRPSIMYGTTGAMAWVMAWGFLPAAMSFSFLSRNRAMYMAPGVCFSLRAKSVSCNSLNSDSTAESSM